MAEIESYVFSHKELVEAMIKQQKIHEGIWELSVEFALAAQNIKMVPPGGNPAEIDKVSPAAILAINKIGIRKVSKDTPLSFDASKINPPAKKR